MCHFGKMVKIMVMICLELKMGLKLDQSVYYVKFTSSQMTGGWYAHSAPISITNVNDIRTLGVIDLHVVVVHLDGRVSSRPCEPHHMVRVVHHLHTDLSYRMIVGTHVVYHVHVSVHLSPIHCVNIKTGLSCLL